MSTSTLSMQIYSLRNAGDFEHQLGLAREAGFEWIESVVAQGLAPQAFADALARHGIRLSSMHASMELLETKPQEAIAACHATGNKLVIMPWLPRSQLPATGAGWSAIGKRLAVISERLAKEGLRLAYHNHDFEFLVYDGRTALEWVFDAVPGDQVGWEADLGWVRRAGQDPMHWIKRYADRLLAVHVKDIAPDGPTRDDDGWCAIGRGIVGWPALLPALKPYCGLFVFEHDNPSEYRDTLKTSLQAMKAGLLG